MRPVVFHWSFFIARNLNQMCLKDVIKKLREDEIDVTEGQIRWAINSGKVSRPPLDGSLRFVFGEEHLVALRDLFGRKEMKT